MSSNNRRNFATLPDRHEEIAKTFYENIEYAHPPRVKGECSHICGRCPWAASCVKYYTYTGPNVNNI